jgi:NADH-ubiquinone oxidoreductase chain 3
MSSLTFFIILVCIIAVLFLVINLVFAPHNPYQEKYSIFECGFHSFLGQNRTQFGVKFFIFALVYLLLDLEILLTFPFAVSGYVNNIYGLIVTLGFIGIITVGFIYELGKSALKIDSKQIINKINSSSSYSIDSVNKNVHLESNIFSSFFFKSIIKYFTLKNLLIGISIVFIVSLLKSSGIVPFIISKFFSYLPTEYLNLTEYFLSGLFVLVWKLSFKGFLECILDKPEGLPLYIGMDNHNSSNEDLYKSGAGESSSSGGNSQGRISGSNLPKDSSDESSSSDESFDESSDDLNKRKLDKGKGKAVDSNETTDDNEKKETSLDVLDTLTQELSDLRIQCKEETDDTNKEDLERQYDETMELRLLYDQFKLKKEVNALKASKAAQTETEGESSSNNKRKALDDKENDKNKQKRSDKDSKDF